MFAPQHNTWLISMTISKPTWRLSWIMPIASLLLLETSLSDVTQHTKSRKIFIRCNVASDWSKLFPVPVPVGHAYIIRCYEWAIQTSTGSRKLYIVLLRNWQIWISLKLKPTFQNVSPYICASAPDAYGIPSKRLKKRLLFSFFCFLFFSFLRRQCGPVVRALALRSGDPGFKPRSDYSLNLILVVPGSTSQLRL